MDGSPADDGAVRAGPAVGGAIVGPLAESPLFGEMVVEFPAEFPVEGAPFVVPLVLASVPVTPASAVPVPMGPIPIPVASGPFVEGCFVGFPLVGFPLVGFPLVGPFVGVSAAFAPLLVEVSAAGGLVSPAGACPTLGSDLEFVVGRAGPGWPREGLLRDGSDSPTPADSLGLAPFGGAALLFVFDLFVFELSVLSLVVGSTRRTSTDSSSARVAPESRLSIAGVNGGR